jgi:hypothetical protein
MDWSQADGEERLALLWLAENMAAHGMMNATTIVEQYKGIRKPLDRNFAYATDKRYKALELDALGAVASSAGQKNRGLDMLRQAQTIWSSLGFDWRAAKSARTIARASGSLVDADEARKHAARWPASWLARPA